MAVGTADFDKGTNGSTIATGDTGSATAWDAVAFTATGLTYATTHPAHGTLGAFGNAMAGNVASYLAHSASLGTIGSTTFGRYYVYLPAYPGASGNFWPMFGVVVSLGGSRNFRFDLKNDGTSRILSNGSTIVTTLGAIPTGQLVRLEFKLIQSATVGQVEIKVYSTADSVTASDSWTSAATLNTNTGATAFAWGTPEGAALGVSYSYYWDQCVANATAYPGPFPVNTTAPTVSGSAPVGSVLTAANGSWNTSGTFNYTYQWTRDGSNIAAATSSTYTTVSGDATHAIGCTVTATGQQATNESAAQASSNAITVTASSPAAVLDASAAIAGYQHHMRKRSW